MSTHAGTRDKGGLESRLLEAWEVTPTRMDALSGLVVDRLISITEVPCFTHYLFMS